MILYLDANNLYGWAMFQVLSYGGFEYVIRSWDEGPATADVGANDFFIDVDLEYTDTTKTKTRYFPLCR